MSLPDPRGRPVVPATLTVTMALLCSSSPLLADDTAKKVLSYVAELDGEVVGGSEAVYEQSSKGHSLFIEATIWILGREKKKIQGDPVMVTHYRIKTSGGKVEEWRHENGTILESVLTTPIGKILIRLTGIAAG